MQANDLWRIRSVDLTKKGIYINKIQYIFGNHELGKGAFGRVYPARRSTDGVGVAIKVISFAESSSILGTLIDSFLNEINKSIELSSESKHVVKMFDFDFDRFGLAFIVMERGDQDLDKTLRSRPPLPIYQQKYLWRQILNILVTLHKHYLVHLDLKPSNLVFFGDRLKLVDLGIAQKANTRRQGAHGTYGFSAPEVHLVPYENFSRFTYKADICVDIISEYSIGAILYWMNYGHSPNYDNNDSCHQPPRGVRACRDENLIDILRHTLRMDYHRRPETSWLTQHPFTRSF